MRTLRGLRGLLRLAVIGLVVAAVATELAKPEEERTWHGRLWGTVPYDFRPPTWERIRSAYWNPDSDVLLSDRVFDVCCAIHILISKRLLISVFDQIQGQLHPHPLGYR